MIEVISLVNFSNEKRVEYINKSFRSFHDFNKNIRHIVLDSTNSIDRQKEIYESLSIEYHHLPGSSYIERLRKISELVKSDYFVFLPDDFVWIYNYPIQKAMEQARRNNVAQIKLSCRGMDWFSDPNPQPKPWFTGNQLISGEKLKKEEDLFISNKLWFRNFHEQFSLAATITNKAFLHNTVTNIQGLINSPGAVEKKAYLKLIFTRYKTAYYDMKIPAFHFCDVGVEGATKEYTTKDMLIESNYELYNSLFNGQEKSSD
ncbi:hypothetical protein A1OW_04965 [Enterovibrio norvegicus]|uniref:hypothetical protein n=1 Tax=Enterovibrio norvegicus TaxID=188144 RepID=UPI0002FB3D28|nr:hypothetical protein [Enterovibrio norvegicus]OEF59623.1 hypothetical protein A1OW_04965 [Enterovibrio norvegicus]